MLDKICIVTGATSGIGKETAIGLAALGAQLVLPVRNMDKGAQLKADIIQRTGNDKVELFSCNLASLQSVSDFANAFLEKYSRLDILINNAGIWETKPKLSDDGIELSFAVNHMAPFLLTNLLLDALKEGASARIINVSSMAHKYGRISFDKLENTRGWGSMQSYAQSKLANILFTRKLARMLDGSGVTANSLHPGVVNTNLFSRMPNFLTGLFQYFLITPEKGAQTSLYLATSPDLSNVSGQYFANKKMVSMSKRALDEALADKLWAESQAIVERII